MADQAIGTGKPARVTAEGSLLSTVRNLWGYMWPAERPDLKLSLSNLVASCKPFNARRGAKTKRRSHSPA